MRRRTGVWLGVVLSALLGWGIAAGAATVTVNPGESIQAAINGASPGDTILLAAGVHDVATTVTVGKGVTVEGLGLATVRGTTSAARNVFKITAGNVTLQGLDVTLSATYALAASELDDALIAVPTSAGLSGVVIQNNVLHWPAQAGAMSTWGGRALTIGGTGAPGVVITGNTVYNTRNGIVVQYNNPATITNNVIYSTKGGVMNYTNNQADADTRIMSGNTWGTVHNEWDIVWNSGGTYFTPDYHQSVLVLSEANNGAYVVDRRDNNAPAYNALGNRSHVFVGTTGTSTVSEVNGNMNVPYANLAAAIDAVVTGGIVYIAAGDYPGQAFIGRDMTLDPSAGVSLKPAATQTTVTIAETTSVFSPIMFVYGGTMDAAKKVTGAGITHADIEDFDIDGQNKAAASPRFVGILLRNVEGAVEDNTIHDMYDADGQGNGPQTFGILVYGDSDVELLGNVISEFSRGGIGVLGDLVGWARGPAADPNATIEGNLVTGNGREAGTGWWAENGIQIGYGATGQILNNTVLNCRVNNASWSSTGILVVGTDNVLVAGNLASGNDDGIAIMGLTAWGGGPSTGNTLSGNDVIGNQYGIGLQYDAVNTQITGNVITGNTGEGVYAYGNGGSAEPYGTVVRYNVIAGNGYGLVHWGVLEAMDAALNWWGANSGPLYDENFDDVPEYAGGGDTIYGSVIFSPWLGENPDGNSGLAGVQITGGVLIVVDDVGPAPTGGYLDAAIGGSNDPILDYDDTILVMDGDFTVAEPITDGVSLGSANGACHTTITGTLTVDAGGVLIGAIRHGFEIHGSIGVEAGVDADTVHINWNDIYDVVTNGGTGRLDATFNYWGTDGPDTVGLVDVYPYLPVPSCTLIGYIDEYGFRVMEAITFAELLQRGLPEGKARVAALIVEKYGIDLDDAMALIREYGLGKAKRALLVADTLDEFLLQLAGYKRETVAGGGGTVGGDLGSYPVGSVVPLFIALADPFTGEPITDAISSYTLTRVLEEGIPEILRFGAMFYDATAGGYSFSLDTTGLEAGAYWIWLGADDGRVVKYTITLTE